MDETEWLAERFEQHRPRLRAVAYRMLGSLAEADDAVQDAWLRLSQSKAEQIDNLGGWLTTVVARECLHMLRSRRVRREDSFGAYLPDPVITADGDLEPEQEALLAEGVGLALLVVLDSLTPAERLAFVLHDMFELPFEEIAGMVGRTPTAARQLASRARRRVKGAEIPAPDPDLTRQRQVVDAFFAAAPAGRQPSSAACGQWPSWPAPHAVPNCTPRWSTARSERWSPSTGGPSPSWPSPSSTARSSRSTVSATPTASAGSRPPSSPRRSEHAAVQRQRLGAGDQVSDRIFLCRPDRLRGLPHRLPHPTERQGWAPLLRGCLSPPAVRDHGEGGVAGTDVVVVRGAVPVAPPLVVRHPCRDEVSAASSLGIALPQEVSAANRVICSPVM